LDNIFVERGCSKYRKFVVQFSFTKFNFHSLNLKFMTLNQFWKGLLVVIISMIATTLATGLPTDPSAIYIFLLSIVGTVIGYTIQHVAFPSTSVLGSVTASDVIKAICVSAVAVISIASATLSLHKAITLSVCLTTFFSTFIGLLAKNMGTNSSGQLAQPESV
jgi:hypothetical protein